MTFDEHLRDELRRATASQPLGTDAALDAVKATSPGSSEPVVVPLDDARRSRPRRVRAPRWLGAAAAIALVVTAVAIPIALRGGGPTDDPTPRRAPRGPERLGDIRLAVASAVDSTMASGSFRVTYTQTEHGPTTPTTGCVPIDNPAPGDGAARQCTYMKPAVRTTTGTAIVNVHPFGMVSESNVTGLGTVTVRVSDARAWFGSGTAPVGEDDPGTALSDFAQTVEGTLGRRAGAGAVMGLASPNGYLAITRAAITGATKIGTGTVNGEAVTTYRVDVDPARLASYPGLSTEQKQTIADALRVLDEEGFTRNTTDISVNERGLVVRAVATNFFADGGTVVGDNTFSDFGCAGPADVPGLEAPPTTLAPSCLPD